MFHTIHYSKKRSKGRYKQTKGKTTGMSSPNYALPLGDTIS